MEIIDITVPISDEIPVWPGDPIVELGWSSSIGPNSHTNITQISMGAHTGTHIDMPLHFIPGGDNLDDLDLQKVLGEAEVVAVPESFHSISGAFLQTLGELSCKRILFKTRNSRYWQEKDRVFHKDFVALEENAAIYLVEHGIEMVGIDYLSIAPYGNGSPVHLALLKAGVVILEGANLWAVEPGVYQLVCLPIKLQGREGAPVRAILIR